MAFSYKWEKKVPQELFALLDDALAGGKFHVVGICVENAKTCEAAIIKHPEVPNAGILMADLWRDIVGDAIARYDEAVANIIKSEVHNGRVN